MLSLRVIREAFWHLKFKIFSLQVARCRLKEFLIAAVVDWEEFLVDWEELLVDWEKLLDD